MFLILPCVGHYLWEKNVALHVIIVLQSTIELIMTYLLQFSILEVEISLTNRITEGYANKYFFLLFLKMENNSRIYLMVLTLLIISHGFSW